MADFWGLGPAAGDQGFALVPGNSECHPAYSQRSQRSLPGPAGRLTLHPAPAASGLLSSGGDAADSAARRPASRGPRLFRDPDFQTAQWLQALQEGGAPFDEENELFRGNTARVAAGLQQSGVLDRLLAVVVTVKRCYSGEAFIRLRDPSGSIGGTLTRAVLEGEPDIRQGAVLRLSRVTILRTPPPRSINHLCITLNSVVQVIPPPEDSSQAAEGAVVVTAQQQQQQPRRVVPALPAPPPAASAQHPNQSWLSRPSSHQQQQQQHPRQQQQQQQSVLQQQQVHPGTARPAAAAPVPSSHGMPPPAARQLPLLPASAPAPSSSFAWPPLGGSGSPVAQQWQQQPELAHQQPVRPPQQQQQTRPQQQQQQSSTFQWPSLGGPATAAVPGAGMPRPPPAAPAWQAAAQPAASASVNFSMPNFSEGPNKQWHQLAWQDDASSLPAGAGGSQSQQVELPGSASQLFATSSQPANAAGGEGSAGAGAGAGWLQGLLAEAEYPVPFGLQPSQQAPPARRPPLADRQQQQQQQQQRQQSAHAQAMHAAKRQRQQQLPALPMSGAVFAGADDLDLCDE